LNIFKEIRLPDRALYLGSVLLLYALIFTVMFMQMAWTRYAAMNLPFLYVGVAMGVAGMISLISKLSILPKKQILTIFCMCLAFIGYSATKFYYYKPLEMHMPRLSTPDERIMAKMFAFSIARPGADKRVHEILSNYFNNLDEKKVGEL